MEMKLECLIGTVIQMPLTPVPLQCSIEAKTSDWRQKTCKKFVYQRFRGNCGRTMKELSEIVIVIRQILCRDINASKAI